MNKLKWIYFLFVIFCVTGCKQDEIVITSEEDMEAVSEAGNINEHSEKASEELIYVYVCGCVNNPGVYSLMPGDRVVDALTLAGGITENGNPLAVNQAQKVTDGLTLYVPGIDETTDAGMVSAVDDGLVNINTADKETLMTVPGIGESKANAIISYREEHGNFNKIEDLMEISGIKEGVFNRIKDYLKVVN
ncbi:MAG: helix-hairpin-helix domain-containing protein [Lachnospiraceae bacterium]